MLFGMIGRTTAATDLKDALDLSANRTRAIATRVAQASVGNANGFALPADPARANDPASAVTGGDPVDIETEMSSLADEQIRFDATAKLLEKTYAQLRGSLKG